MMEQSEFTTCHYHPANNAITSCEVCHKDICVFDKQIYRKKVIWFQLDNI